jgi:probable addiction module antidote protein
MTMETTRFDAAEHLDSPEAIAAYLAAAFEDGDQELMRAALNDVARARGMSSLERETGLKRETLYKAFSEKGNPTLDTLTRVLGAFGVRLAVEPTRPFEG